MTQSSSSRNNFMASAKEMIKSQMGIDLTLEQVTTIVGDKMDGEWQNFDYKEVSKYMDTAPRENIMDIVAEHYLGRPWPTYGERVNMEHFIEDLMTSVEMVQRLSAKATA